MEICLITNAFLSTYLNKHTLDLHQPTLLQIAEVARELSAPPVHMSI